MPIYDIVCSDCGYTGEALVLSPGDLPECPACASRTTRKLMSPTSSLTGKAAQHLPGPGDTACCGQSPSAASCSGPGSCCGKAR
jgi:putative FmdB family regulatory protein